MGVAIAIATGVTLLSLFESYFLFPRQGAPPPPLSLLIYKYPSWLYWALLVSPIFWLEERLPLERETFARGLGIYFLAGVLVVVGHVLVSTGSTMVAFPDEGGFVQTALGASTFSHISVLLFAGIIGFGRARRVAKSLQRRRSEEADLRAELVKARLLALRGQLQPHFLFNTLHAITVLVRRDPALAEQTLTRLGDLLRMTLEDTGRASIPLQRELAYLRIYLEIQKVRFGDRLRITHVIDDEAFLASIPSLLLQPLVENAVLHGLEAQPEGVHVTIGAARLGDRLCLSVVDDGPGLNGLIVEEGVGLSTTRERLERTYGNAGRIAFENVSPHGLAVRVEIPWSIGDPDD